MGRIGMGAVALGVTLFGGGCTGIFEGDVSSGAGAAAGSGTGGSGGSSGSAGGGGGLPPKLTPEQEVQAGVGVSRLTKRQYNNSVSDLVATQRHIGDELGLPIDDALGGYEVGVTHTNETSAEKLLKAAEEVASLVLSDKTKLGCDPATGEDACAEKFIRDLVRRAYRRAPDSEQIESLLALYRSTKASYGFDDGLRVVIEAVVASPYFLYHLDPLIDEDPSLAPSSLQRVSGYGMAARLSYYLWGSLPDDALLTAAQQGELTSTEQLRAQAERMIADPRARRGFHDFAAQWLQLNKLADLNKSATTFPDYTPATRDTLRASLDAFVDEALTTGTLGALLSADYAYVDENLAALLGISGVTGSALTRVRLDPGQYRGLLTQPTLMAMFGTPDEAHPIKRGAFVMDHVLCQPSPPPTEDLPPFPEIQPGLTNRQRVDKLTSVAPCINCHRMINPIGFSFERYDAVGRYRASDAQGLAIDSSSTIVGMTDETLNGASESALSLIQRLEQSDQVSLCMVKQFYRAAVKRQDTPLEEATLLALLEQFKRDGGAFASALVGVTQTNAFTYRRRAGAKP